MSRVLRILVVLSMCLQTVGMAVGPSYAGAPDPDAIAAAGALGEFARKLDKLAFLEELGAAIPFTAVSPSDTEALNLSHLFGDTLGQKLNGFAGDADDLKAAIETAGDLWISTDMEVTYGAVEVADSSGFIDVTFSVTAIHTVSLPVSFYTDTLPFPYTSTVPIDLGGGEFEVTLQLSTTLDFQLDKNETDPYLAFYLDKVPVMDVTISAAGLITGFEDLLGFTDIGVTGVVTLNEQIGIDFQDPDDIAPFTRQEWTQSAIEDLVAIEFEAVLDEDDVNARLTLDSNLVSCEEDGSISLAIADLGPAYDPPATPLPNPTITLCSDLAKFANAGPNDVLAGLGQFAIAIGAAQITNDIQLPYLRDRLSAGFAPGKALFDLVKEQGDALIMCGTANTVPPSGDPTAGGTIYCQTFAPTDPISVTWSIRAGATGSIVSGETATTTVGVRPTSNVKFSGLPADQLPPVQVKFRDPSRAGEAEGEVHTVTPRVRTAQELLDELQGLAGTNAGLEFDPVHSSLAFSITMNWDPNALDTELAFGDQLRQATNLAGLSPGSGASASFDVDDASLVATFGVILVDDVADITPDDDATFPPRDNDRFFMGVAPTSGAHEFLAGDLTVDVAVDLVGKIGFLEVKAEGDPAANLANNAVAFEIAPITDTLPVLAVDINPRPGGVPISGTTPIADAILVRSLLSDTVSHVSRSLNLKMSAGLTVSATLSASDPLTSGVAINWPDLSTGQPVVTPDAAFRTTLQRFDVVPTVSGFHNGIEDSAVLTDTTRSFLDAFGLQVSPGEFVPTMLFNTTDGSSCASFIVTDEHTLTCAEFDASGQPISGTLKGGVGLEDPDSNSPGPCDDSVDNGGDGLTDADDPDCTTNDWDVGDRYQIPGDPQALGTIVLENLYDLAARMATVTTGTWSTSASLPLIGLSPKELVPQFAEVTEAIVAINEGNSDVKIGCETASGRDLVQSPTVTETIYCTATAPISTTVTDVSWTIANSTIVTNATSVNTVGTLVVSPTESVEFRVDDFTSFYVAVEFTDDEGITRRGRLPQEPPLSLRELEVTLESTLGIPPDNLTFELTDLDNPATGGTLKHLVLRLGLDDEGSREVRLRMDLPGVEDPESSTPGPCNDGIDNGGDGDTDGDDSDCDVNLQVIGDEPSPTLPLTYTSHVQLDFGIPLSNTLAPSNTAILESTGAWLSAGLETTGVDITATLGALSVHLGQGLVLTGTHTEDFVITGTHTSVISSTTMLTDTDHTYTGGWNFVDLQVRTGVIISNTTDTADCIVGTVTADTITCQDPLSNGGIWDQGDYYKLVGPSRTILHDSTRNFVALSIGPGDELWNTTDNVSCTIAEVYEHDLVCDAPLPGDNLWNEDDEYEIRIAGVVKFDANFSLSKPGSDPGNDNETSDLETFIAGLEISITGPDTANDCGPSVSGDVCARLPVGIESSASSSLAPTSGDAGDDDGIFNGVIDRETRISGLETSLMSPDAAFPLTEPGSDPEDGDGIFNGIIEQETPNSGLKISLDQSPIFLGILTFWMADVGDAGTANAYTPPALNEAAAKQELEWSLLPLAVPELRFILGDNLDGEYWGERLPLVGEDLAAGAVFDAPILNLGLEIGDQLDLSGVVSATELITPVQNAVLNAIQATGGISLVAGSSVSVTVKCAGGDCNSTHELGDVDEVEIKFDVGHNLNASGNEPEQGCANGSCGDAITGADFDIGLPGLPVTSDDELASRVGWKLHIGFGLSRIMGPYLKVDTPDELKLGARVTISDTASGCDEPYRLPSSHGLDFSDTRCLEGVLGFLEGSMYDGDVDDGDPMDDYDDRTVLNLLTKLDVTSDSGYLTFGQLMDGTSGHEVKVAAEANIDLSFTTGPEGESVRFPTLVGTFHLTYSSVEVTLPRSSDEEPFGQPQYKHLYLDPSLFFGQFIGPMVEEVQKYTKPFQPVIDTITAPIPVISDLSEMVGGGPVTLLSLMEAISGNDLSMIQRIADFITFFNNLPADESGILLALGPGTDVPGEFAVKTSTVRKPDCGQEKKTGDTKSTQTCTQDAPLGSAGKQWQKIDKSKVKSGTHSSGYIDKTRTASGGGAWGDPGISFPFLDDTAEIYGMLMGEDADLLYVDLGTFSASAGVSWSFGPIFAGPVPLNINIGGSVTLSGRFAIGFDTRGLRSYLSGGSFVDVLIDGIYLDDYDINGNEVPEIKLILTFWAGASVGFLIFEAGLSAGADFTITLDLNDPNNDGKMRIDEIVLWRFNPICLFVTTGTIEFFLKVYLKIDLFLFTKKFEWELYRTKPPIQLFEIKCEPPKPVLAQPDTYDVNGDSSPDNVYRFNIGPHISDRNVFLDVTKEKYIVRQLTEEGQGCSGGPAQTSCTPGGTWIGVTFQGIRQDHFVPNGYVLYADAGSENDVIKLLPGGDEDGNEIPFTLDAYIWGGDGDDEITTGEGDDVVDGGAGNDKIYAQEGDDTILGGGGSDIIEGKIGDDVIDGGDGDDTLLNGGPGKDLIRGGSGNDILSGGPGLPPDFAGAEDRHKDGNDVLIGDDGDDDLDGGFGDDWAFGDNLQGYSGGDDRALLANPSSLISVTLACDPTGIGTGQDEISGGDGEDHLFGGQGHDSLTGGEENDTLCGNGGNDALDGEEGDDTLQGGNDNDVLYGQTGHDALYGGNGDDVLWGGDDHDDLVGGAGSDALLGELGHDIMLGDGDEDSLAPHTAADHGADKATILALVSLGSLSGDGTVSCTLRVDVYDGRLDLDGDGDVDSDDDGLFEGYTVYDGEVDLNHDTTISISDTGKLKDTVVLEGRLDLDSDGAADDDGLLEGVAAIGSGNADCMYGDVGNDYLFGGPSGDKMYGDLGTDYMQGNDDDDTMRGGKENDEMYGNAGADTMYGDSGDDQMFGGSFESGDDTGDTMYGNAGDDVMLGDNGMITASSDEVIQTSDPTHGGDDEMYGNGGDDIILGGAAGDFIWGNTGTDIIMGDNGQVTRSPEGEVKRIETTDEEYGGADTIEGNEAEDIILGGEEGDTISGDEENDTILGDNGVVVKADGSPEANDVYTTDPLYGGSDTIEGNAGDDLILGGSGGTDLGEGNLGDTITGHTGEDIILGDNGYITRTADYVVRRIASTYPDKGAGDVIAGSENKDIILGGHADDDIAGDGGADTILGDNGVVVRADGSDQANDVYTTDPLYGGSDTIEGNAGDDLILGGSGGTDLEGLGGDTITGNPGEDIILGDNGYITRNWEDVVEDTSTTYPGIGGGDTVYGNDGDDLILGGADGDKLSGNDDDDIILGDNGRFDYLANDTELSSLDVVSSTYPTIGGSDVITAGAGEDLVFGGTISDTITGNEDHDILLGDHGLWDDSRPLNQQFLCIYTDQADGGGRDIIHGNDGDDFILGQQENDELYGDADQDDMTGGHNVPGGADGADTMYGESGTGDGTTDGSHGDVMLGDNGVISRTLDSQDDWVVNPFNGTYARVVQLLDVETVTETVSSSVYGDDEMWGNDNDDIMYGQGGEDRMYGGAGDDYMEGNAASDVMEGNGEDDDMLGGTGPTISNDPSTAIPGRTDESTRSQDVPMGADPAVTVPLGDEMYGGEGADVMLGDNGIITRPLDGNDHWITLSYSLSLDTHGGVVPRHPTGGTGARVDRVVQMVDTTPGRTAGSDLMYGGAGDDDIYGQFDDTGGVIQPAIGDDLYGQEGEDAMVGDNGIVDNWVVVSPTQWIEPHEPFVDDHIFVQGSLFREVTLEQINTGGNDRMTGGPDGDWMHGSAGEDLMNGNSGNDRLFGDDGDDALWGGPHHDHLWGGWGGDYLDVRPRPDDPEDWFAYAATDHYQHIDYVYGGWDQDAMQANVADMGPVIGDRLIDWVGAYNVYYLCPALYGEFVNTRDHSPAIIEFLQDLSAGDGAVDTATENTSGFNEVAIVFPNQAGQNSHPPHPDNPGHFTCDIFTQTVRTTSIDLSYQEKKGQAMVEAEVMVQDEYSATVKGASVVITWSVPSGVMPITQTTQTDKNGIAQFAVVDVAGVYTLTVVDVVFEDYVFDRENSILSAWTSPSQGALLSETYGQQSTFFLPIILKQ